MSADVARAQDRGDHLLVGLVVEPTEVDHDGKVVAIAGLDGLLHRDEVGLLPVRGLDSDDDVAIVGDGFRKRVEIHVVLVLLGGIVIVGHAGADDVDEGEDTGTGVVDDATAELGEVPPARRAGVGDGGDAVGDGEGIGGDGEVAVPPGVVAKAGEDVDVDVDQARSEVEAGDIDRLLCGGGGNREFDGGDLAIANGDVALGVDVVLWVDQVAIAEDEVELLGRRRDSAEEKGGGEESEHDWEYSQAGQCEPAAIYLCRGLDCSLRACGHAKENDDCENQAGVPLEKMHLELTPQGLEVKP